MHVTQNYHFSPCARDQCILPDSGTWKHAGSNFAKGSRILRASAEFVWDCVETAFQIDRYVPYHARLAALNDAHIGLWDVLASCSRKASSDTTIHDAKCNDFVKLLSAYPQMNRICLNGRTAVDYWRRLVIPSFANEIANELLADVEIIGLPSTSPAHAALSPAAKIDAWCAALGER